MAGSVLISAKRGITLEILAKLKVKISGEEIFAEYSIAIHNPSHSDLFQNEFKSMKKRYYF